MPQVPILRCPKKDSKLLYSEWLPPTALTLTF
jgi:hypothetical protein